MRIHSIIRRVATLPLVLVLALPACSALKDRDPFTVQVTLDIDQATGGIILTPSNVIEGNWSFGKVQVNNLTGKNHGFAIDDLAIYELIPRDTSPLITISDARDDTTYMFYCHIHDVGVPEGTEYRGELKIDYAEEVPI